MSKGLGKSYLTENMCHWHYDDMYERMYLNLPDGGKCAMPRYYKDKIYYKEDRIHIGDYQYRRMCQKLDLTVALDASYYRNKAESDRVSFERMYQVADLGRNIHN